MTYLEGYNDFFTIPDICEVLRIGRAKCYEHLRTGKIKSFQINNTYKVCIESIEEYIETNGYTRSTKRH